MNVAINGMLLSPPYTGVQRYISGLISAVASRVPEIKLSVYIGRKSPWRAPEGVMPRRALAGGRLRPARIAWEQCVLPFRLRLDDIDVLHAPGYVMPALASIVGKCPTVLTVHDTIALDCPDLVSQLNVIHYGLTMPLSLRLASCVIVPSKFVAERIIAGGFGVRRLEVIPWGVDQKLFSASAGPRDDTLLEELGVNPPYVLQVGRMEPKKNGEDVVKAFFAAKLQAGLPHRLVLAGARGPSSRTIESLVDELDMSGSVVMTGHVSDEVLSALYRKADLVVCASIEEGFGFPPLEALLCGTPVIAADIGPFRETLGGEVPLVAPGDTTSLRREMECLLGDESAGRDILKRGRKRALTFTWEKCAKRTRDIYLSV